MNKQPLILCISALDKESTAAILKGEQVLGVCCEEHLTRVKQQDGFPKQSIEHLFKRLSIRPSDIDAVTYPFYEWPKEMKMLFAPYPRDFVRTLFSNLPWKYKILHLLAMYKGALNGMRQHIMYQSQLLQGLKSYGLEKNLKRVHHQSAHAASCFYTSGWDQALILTVDGYGSGSAGIIAVGDETGIKVLDSISHVDSLGAFYAKITKALGFKPDRHEGKILGLAAYGKFNQDLHDQIQSRFQHNDASFEQLVAHSHSLFVQDLLKTYSREDISFAWQSALEDNLTRYVKYWLSKTGMKRVVMAGGVAANVKFNQRVAEIPGVEEVYIHPAMNDSGTSVGAGLYYLSLLRPVQSYQLRDVYFGPQYSDQEIQSALDRSDLSFEDCGSTIEERVAELLSQKKVVALYDGALEYGPRALGHRSILYHLGDTTVNDWLNKKLKRTEFMPFAPVTLEEDAGQNYLDLEKGRYTSRFMTITFDCTDEMKRTCPAAVHVDGTARPQLVSQESNPSLYRILSEYKKRTGISSVLNTSFNMHEEPIVCSPEDAIRAFKESELDYLAIGSFLARQPHTLDEQQQETTESVLHSC